MILSAYLRNPVFIVFSIPVVTKMFSVFIAIFWPATHVTGGRGKGGEVQ